MAATIHRGGGPWPSGDETTSGAAGSWSWNPAVLRIFRDIDGKWLAAAMALFFFGNCLVVTRWWRLLRAIGVGTRWRNVFRLNFLGLFFNAVFVLVSVYLLVTVDWSTVIEAL